MTAIVAGQGLGLFNTSANVLGGDSGQIGVASQGRSGEKVVVNASTGNLLVQQQDEWLVGRGQDVGLLRTYNSLATGDGDNNDNWRLGWNRKVNATSTTAASVTRIGEDGVELTYSNINGKFVNKDGSGSFDTLTWDATSTQWVWEDGNTHVKEYYQAVGSTTEYRLVKITDAGNSAASVTITYDPTSGLITGIATAGGELMELTYEAAAVAGKKPHIKSVQLKSTANATVAYNKRVTYDYDPQDRLKKVWVDLSPTDLSTADGKVYWTEYTYIDTTSNRLKTLKQSDDSQLEFHYDASNRIDWIKESLITGGEVRQTSFTYLTGAASAGNTTQITDASGNVTELTYVNTAGASYGQIQSIKRPMSGASLPTASFTYDADGNVLTSTDARGNKTTYRYDGSGNNTYQEDAQGNVTERTYNSANMVLTEIVYSNRDTDMDGGASGALTTRYLYDATYPTRLRFMISPEGRVTQYTYNGLGQRTSAIQYSASAYTGLVQDFGVNTTGLTTSPAFVLASNQLQYTASTAVSTASISTTDASALGTLWSMEVSTPAAGSGTDLLFLGLESGTAATSTFRRLRLRLSGNQFYTEQQSGTSANTAVLLGTAKAGTTYIVEFDTAVDGSMTLYAYEKGKERSTGLKKVVAADAGWTAPKLYIQGNSGTGAIAGVVAIDNLAAQWRPTLTDMVNWSASLTDKTSWSRTDYIYDPLRGQLQSETTYASSDATTGAGYISPEWSDENWSDNYTQYIYDQSGNLLQKIDGAKVDAITYGDNSWALDQRKRLGIVYTVAGPNGGVGEGKKTVDLTTTDLALIASKASFNTVFVYDGLNRITKQTDPSGNVTLTTYDDASRTTKVELANGLTTTSTYDRSGTLLVQAQVDKAAPGTSLGSIEYTYDKMGRLTSTKVTSTGERTYILYDALGRKVGDIDAEGALTEYRYNNEDQLTRTVAYANKVSSAVLAALALDPSAATVPANQLANSLSGWTSTSSNAAKITSGLNTATANTSGTTTLAGDNTMWLKQLDADATLTSQLQSGNITLPTSGSRRFEVSAYVGVVNATATLSVQFFNVVPSNSTVPLSSMDIANTSATAGGANLSNYTRLAGYVDAPAGALYARVVVKKTATVAGQSSSLLYVTHPLLAQTAVSGTLSKPFAALDVRPVASATEDRGSWNIYDKAGRLAKTILVRGEGDSYQYELGQVTEYRYDGAGRLTDTIAYATPLSLDDSGTAPGLTKLRSALGEVQAGDGTLTIDGITYTLMLDAANDRRTRNFYSADGLLIGQLDGENYFTKNTYDNAGRLLTNTRYGRAIASVVPDGNTPPVPQTSLLFDFVLGYDRTTRYYYNGRGQLVGMLDAELYYTAYQYDIGGNKMSETRYATQVVNAVGSATIPSLVSVAAQDGKPYVVTNSEDHATRYFYDANNRLLRKQESPSGVVTTYEYNSVGKLTKSTVALGTVDERIAQKRYDAAGRVIAELGGVGSTKLAGLTDQSAIDTIWKTYGTQYLYDAGGRLTATITPDGSSATGLKTIFYYDKAGRMTHSINALGEVKQYTYNAFGEQSEVRGAATRVASTTLAGLAGGLNTSLTTGAVITGNSDSVTTMAYSRAGQLRHLVDAEGNASDTWYNAFGQVLWSEPPRLNGIERYFEYAYDRRGLVKKVTDIDGTVGIYSNTSSQYNAFGQLMTSTDARGKVTTYAYDKLGRTYAITDAGTLNFGVATTYDAFNRVVTQTDRSAQHTTTYRYDSANLKVTIATAEGVNTDPNANSANTGLTFQSVQVLNREGQIVSVTDGRGGYTQYTYDADGHLTNTMVKNASTDTDAAALTSESNTYDSAGRISTTTNAMGGLTTITYDKVNRALTQTQTDGLGNTFKTQWRYDALGRAVWKQNAAGTWTQTSFDRNGRVKTVVVDPKSIPRLTLSATAPDIALNVNSAGLALTTQFDYDEQGHVISQTEGAGSSQPRKTQYKYDLRGRRQFEIVDPDGLALITEYVYDVNDNVVARLETKNASVKQTTRYVYDSSNRLSWQISATGAVTQTEYDAAGNISRLTAYAKLVDLTAADLQNLQGLTAALVSAKVGAPNASVDHVTRYVYDADNRLIFTIDSQGYGTRNEYDKAGNVVVATRYAAKIPMLADPGVVDGRVRFVVDMTALAALDADAKNQVDQYIYDGAHRVVGHVDAQGGYTLTEYRNGNREVRTTRYANAVVYPTTAPTGSVKNRLTVNTAPATSSTAPVAASITVPTLQLSSGPTGKDVVSYQWLDALGQVSGKQDGAGYVTTYKRDGMGRVLSTVDQSNNAQFNVYDKAGRLTLATDALGTITKTSYDALGNVKETSLVEGGLPLDMGVSVGYGGKLARDLSAIMGNINNGDTVTVNGWFKADDGVSALMTLGNQAGTVLVSSATKNGVRKSDAAWLGFTLTYTHNSTTPMALWLTMSGDTNALHAGMDSNILYDDLSLTVQRSGSTTPTQVWSDDFSNSDANAALTGYTVTGDVSRLQYQYLDGLNGQSISDAANSAGAVATHVTSYAYDNAGRLIEQTQAKGTTEQATTRYVLDKLGQREKVIDPRGIEAAEGNSAWAQAYRQSKLGYTSAPDKTTKALDYQKLLDDFTTTQVFDAQGRITQSKDSLGGTTNTQFDAFGNAIRIQDPNANHGYFFFNELNQATWQVDPLGYATETRYNSLGQVDTIVKYAKALKNWTAGTTSPAVPLNPDAVTAYKAANSGALPSGPYVEADALDATTTIGHDKLGRQTSIKDAMGFTESMAYDALGNKTSYTGKSNTSKTTDAVDPYKYEYDKRGLLIKETLPVKVTKLDLLTGEPVSGASPVEVVNKYEYDARGNRTKLIEAAGLYEERKTVFKYDQLDRQIERTGEAIATYTLKEGDKSNVAPKETRLYDAAGNLLEVKSADGARTLGYYDNLNRKVAELRGTAANADGSQNGTLTLFEYNTGGDMIRQRVFATSVKLPTAVGVRAPDAPTGSVRETQYVHDGNHNLLEIITPDVLYGQDEAGVYRIRADKLKVSRFYDANGNMTKEVDARGNATRHYFDKAGNETATVDAKRYLVVKTYDGGGNLISEIRYANAIAANFDLGAETEATIKQRVTLSADDRKTTYTRDQMGHLKTQELAGVEAYKVNTVGALSTDATVARTTFAYNGLGQITSKIDAQNSLSEFMFDQLGRQTQEKKPTYFDQDSAPVIPLTDTAYDGLGQIASVATRGKTSTDDRIETYRYDKNGNQASRKDAKGVITSFSVDVVGRVTRKSVARTNSDGSSAGTDITVYDYDLVGRQTQQIVRSRTLTGSTLTTTDLESKETQYDAFGAIVAKGTNSGLQEYWEYDNAGRLIKSNEGSGITKAYVRDANGNATLEIDSTGTDLKPLTLSQILGLNGGINTIDSATQAVLQAGGTAMTVSVYDERNQLTETRQPSMATDAAQQTATQVLNRQQSGLYAVGSVGVGKAFNGISTTATPPPLGATTSFISVGTVTATVTADRRDHWMAMNGSNWLGFGDGNPHYVRDFAVSISGVPPQQDKFRLKIWGAGGFSLSDIAFDRRGGAVRLGSPAKGVEWVDISYDWATSSINIHMYGHASGDNSSSDFYNSGNYAFSVEGMLEENSPDYLGLYNAATLYKSGQSTVGSSMPQANNYIVLPNTVSGATNTVLTLTPAIGGTPITVQASQLVPLRNSAGATVASRLTLRLGTVPYGQYKFSLAQTVTPNGVYTITGNMNLSAQLPSVSVDQAEYRQGDSVSVAATVSGTTNKLIFTRNINYDTKVGITGPALLYRKKAALGATSLEQWKHAAGQFSGSTPCFLTQDSDGNELAAGDYEYQYEFRYGNPDLSGDVLDASYAGDIKINGAGIPPTISAPVDARDRSTTAHFFMSPTNGKSMVVSWRIKGSGQEFNQTLLQANKGRFSLDTFSGNLPINSNTVIEYSYKTYLNYDYIAYISGALNPNDVISSAHGEINFADTVNQQSVAADPVPTKIRFDVDGFDQSSLNLLDAEVTSGTADKSILTGKDYLSSVGARPWFSSYKSSYPLELPNPNGVYQRVWAVQSSASDSSASYVPCFNSADFGLKENTTYTFSVWAKLVGGIQPSSGSLISSSFNDGSGSADASLSFKDIVLDSNWREYSLTFTNQQAIGSVDHLDRFLVGLPIGSTVALWGAKIIEQKNLIASANDATASPWLPTGTTVAASTVTAPTGIPVKKLVEAATTGKHAVSQPVTIAEGGRYSYSVDLKAGERSKALVSVWDGQVQHGVYVDLATGKVTNVDGTLVTYSVAAKGNGWYTLTLVCDLAPGMDTVSITLLDGTGANSYLGTAGSGLYLTHASLSRTAVNAVPFMASGQPGKQGRAAAPVALGMKISYGAAGSGSTGSYTFSQKLSRQGVNLNFVLDASNLIPPNTAGSMDYSYTLYADAACTIPLLDPVGSPVTAKGTVNVASSATSPDNVQWTLLGLGSQDRVIKRGQSYNAFGEVESETDGRQNVTNMRYNTLGLLTEKKDPTVTYTKDGGAAGLSQQTARPTTNYRYDLLGRMVGIVDANGNLNTQQWLNGDTQRVAAEFHADGGIKRNNYDIFGDLRNTTDELNRVTKYSYDKRGQVIKVERPTRLKSQSSRGNSTGADLQAIDEYAYDELGHRITHSNNFMTSTYGASAKEITSYDALGRVKTFKSFADSVTSYDYLYDAAILGAGGRAVGGYKTTTKLGDGHAQVDSTNVFGVLTKHLDFGNNTFIYNYDSAGWLKSQTSAETGQNIAYTYYANGYVKTINDLTMGTFTGYEYDKDGNRVREYYQRGSGAGTEVLQDATITYDAMNRMTTIHDGGADIQYKYDANGNRMRVLSYYHSALDGSNSTQDYWYAYDSMNRFVITKGSLDSQSNRVITGANGISIGYDVAGQRVRATTGASTETYTYSDDGYLVDTILNGSLYAHRDVDLAGRTKGYQQNDASALLSRTTTYDADNRVLVQDDTTTKGGQVTNTTNTSYSYFNNSSERQSEISATGKGQLAKTVMVSTDTDYSQSTPKTTKTTSNNIRTYQWWDDAKEILQTAENVNVKITPEKSSKGFSFSVASVLTGGNAVYANGFAVHTYDVNGHLLRVDDPANQTPGVTDKGRSITYVANAEGLILSRRETANGNANANTGIVTGGSALKFRRFYYVNGHVVGDISNDGIDQTQTSYAEQMAAIEQRERNKDNVDRYARWKPIASANFDENYQPINSTYPGSASYSYTVRSSTETLQSIAMSVWGDSSMWYLIADANGLRSNTTLVAGQSLTIPNKVTNIHNNSSTYRVYDAGVAIGDVSPTAPFPPPPPPPKKGCGVVGQVLMIVAAIAVAYFTAGAALSFFAPGASSVAGAVAAGGMNTVAGLAAAAIGGAAGAVASQLVGMATGDVEKFSWSAVGRGAVMGAISAGAAGLANASGLYAVDGLGKATSTWGAIGQGALTNTLTQGIAVATGLQRKFSWTGVAAAAVGSAASLAANNAMGTLGSEFFGASGGKLIRDTISGVADGAARSVVQGRRPDWTAVTANAFGSALGDAVVGAIQRGDVDRKLAQAQADKTADWRRDSGAGDNAGSGNIDARMKRILDLQKQIDQMRGQDQLTLSGEGTIRAVDSQAYRDAQATAAVSRDSAQTPIRETVWADSDSPRPSYSLSSGDDGFGLRIPVSRTALDVAGGVGNFTKNAVYGAFDMSVAPLADVAQVGMMSLYSLATGETPGLHPVSSFGSAVVNGDAGIADGLWATGKSVFSVSPAGLVFGVGKSSYDLTTAISHGDVAGATEAGLGLGLGMAGVRATGSGLVANSGEAGGAGLTGKLWSFDARRDIDLRGSGSTWRDGVNAAFERIEQKSGTTRDQFDVTKWGKTAEGKTVPVEWRGPGNAEVNLDIPDLQARRGVLPNGPSQPHIGWKAPGRVDDGRGHIFIDKDLPATRPPLGVPSF